MPELEMVQKVASTAHQVQERLKNELFGDEYNGLTDVNNARLPDGKSLIANNGDLVLHQFTGSQMYTSLRQTLQSIQETVVQLPVRTPEKATLEWMTKIFTWVESIQSAECYSNDQLVIKIEHALEILEQGHRVFYCVSDEVQSYLRGRKVGLQVFPQKFDVDAMKGGSYTLGLGLLRWAALLFECLQSDVDEEDRWKVRALEKTNSFTTFEFESSGGTVTSFMDADKFRDDVKSLIAEASTLIVQDDELLCSLSLLPEKAKNNALFQKSLEAERIAIEEKEYLLLKEKFENPQNIVNDRFELLDSLMRRLPPSDEDDDKLLPEDADDNSLFVGEPSVRDKSRFFLEKSLFTGIETLGLDPKEEEINDFCSIFAWNLEDAVNNKYHNVHDSSAPISSEYRDKIRSLRFNLQDPKNPMLCARVLSGGMSIEELISASTEDLASTELKRKRRKVEEEARKSVVLSADSAKQKPPPTGITSELAAKIRIEGAKMEGSSASEAVSSAALKSEEDYDQDESGVGPAAASTLASSLRQNFHYSPASPSSPSVQHVPEETKKILASLPPPPMGRMKNEHRDQYDSDSPPPSPLLSAEDPPPSPLLSAEDQPPSPLLSAKESYSPNARSRSQHITSQTGTDLFQITISKLKLSFTTKIAADQSCKFEVDCFLPSILVEKGRLPIDDLNKFIYDKTKSGRWNLAHLKLSSITGDSNTSSYKKFYKEYESLNRIAMIQVSDTTKAFLITPKFLRVCKCLNSVENLSRSSTYVVILTKEHLPPKSIE